MGYQELVERVETLEQADESALVQRVEQLEQAVAELKKLLASVEAGTKRYAGKQQPDRPVQAQT